MKRKDSPFAINNIRYFIGFRLFFNARFYYPVFTILFLDYGLTIEQFALLNSVWAATIVLAEVPSGALADILGRKQLLIITTVLMILEMMLLSFVPLHNISLVFWAFFLNRILSGLAEAMASGADEALAYDSLVEKGTIDDWPVVLSVMMRVKSLGSVITMSFGALIYDPDIVNKVLHFVGFSLELDQQVTMRFPIYLTLVLGFLSLYSVLRMQETENGLQRPTSGSHLQNMKEAMQLTLEAGRWILSTPFALAVILFGMAYDHILRMIITMTSQYLRLVGLPEASFGLIGAASALIGLFIPKIAEKMVKNYSAFQNMICLTVLTFATLAGLAAFIPYLGLIPIFMVSAGIMFTSFFTSHYLNKITDSHQRATVLSFKGLAFNLAYGMIGVAFAALIVELRNIKSAASPQAADLIIENQAFITATAWFIPYTFLVLAGILVFSAYLLRKTDLHKLKG